jgi:hypothetical protein
MKPLPMILVREFAGLNESSYRIASNRARNYWVRSIDKPRMLKADGLYSNSSNMSTIHSTSHGNDITRICISITLFAMAESVPANGMQAATSRLNFSSTDVCCCMRISKSWKAKRRRCVKRSARMRTGGLGDGMGLER